MVMVRMMMMRMLGGSRWTHRNDHTAAGATAARMLVRCNCRHNCLLLLLLVLLVVMNLLMIDGTHKGSGMLTGMHDYLTGGVAVRQHSYFDIAT